MSSSSFAPLAEAVPKVFRPFGSPPPAEAATEPTPAPAPGPPAEEIERAFGAGVERGRTEAHAELEATRAAFADSLRELVEFRARLKDVEQAQARIVAAARRLDAEQRITLGAHEGDVVV